ncbi:MAG: nucleotidyltransferase family protein [Cyanobacteria bacterium]|nr:nucleotidyltransferase family protein [Cyanobacteriota bacterium]
MTDLSTMFVSPATAMREVIERIDRTRLGIALVVDDERRLIGAITDGDVRRALLAGLNLETRAEALLKSKADAAPRVPITASEHATKTELLDLMNRHDLRHIPLIDSDGRVVGIEALSNLVSEYQLPLRAVVMAGGLGTRLRPLTDERPKAMLPVGDRPLLEVIVDQLQQAGIRRVSVATHYKGDMIERHFGDGSDFGVEIGYISEDEPLGTAGALAKLPESNEPVLVMNGDILSRINLVAMLDFHRSHGADMTIAVRPYQFQVPYGVVRSDGIRVTAVDEKPVVEYLVNAGIYLLDGAVCRLVPAGQRFDMTDLIQRAMTEGRTVLNFPLHEEWIDVGRREDYARAQSDFGGKPRGED